MPTLEDAEIAPQNERKEATFACYETDPRWLAVLRVTNSEHFAKASRLCQFLVYIAERSLTGRTEEITEQQIGVHVFGKPATYNPSDDTIVRATARQLRQRLAVYYQEVKGNEQIKITIPRGGYLPIFTQEENAFPVGHVRRDTTVLYPIDDSKSVAASPDINFFRPYRSWQKFGLGILVGLALSASLYLVLPVLKERRSPAYILWGQLFNQKQDTLIVAGDAGLNIFENLSRHQVDLDAYSSHSYLNDPEASTPAEYSWDPLATRTYTTFQNLRLASRLTSLPGLHSLTTRIKFARELSIEDLKQSNAILLGSPQYDPWEHLFDNALIFTIDYDGATNTITVINRAPQRGEMSRYVWSPSNPDHVGYALITLTNNLSGKGKVLLVEGTTAAGDDAAGDFLLDDQALGDALKPLKDASGRLHNFQILLETLMTDGDSHASHVIAERILHN